MVKEEDSVLHYMSERLKQEPYINNSNSKLFLAEVAIVIIHILQKDGKFDLHINDCFSNYKDRIFDFSLKKIEATRNFNYFKEKEAESLSLIFQDMLDLYFSKKEIRSLMQQFDGVESIDDDYNIIFKKKDNSNLIFTKQESIGAPFVINKQTKEQEIINYFNNKIKEGYYTDIYKLLVDFSMMMYRKGALSIDLSFPKFDEIIKYINTQIISKLWFHQLSSDQLIPKFTYCWKNAKFNIIKKAADALQIPYQLTGEKRSNNQQIILVQAKGDHRNSEENIVDTEVRGTTPIIEEIKEIVKTEEVVKEVAESKTQDNLIIPHKYSYEDVETKLSELFDISETVLLEEELLLQEINVLICSHAWENVYDLFGDIQYIIYNQKRLATYTNRTVIYKNVKLSQFESRHAFFLKTFKKRLKLDTRQNSRKSYREVWYDNYTVSTIEKIGLQFEPIKCIKYAGDIILNDFHISFNESCAYVPLMQRHSPNCVFDYKDQLDAMYENSNKIFLQESDIIFLHRRIAERSLWENWSKCIASIAYILIRQIGLKSNGQKEQYKLLINLYRKSVVLKAKYELFFNDNNHKLNLEKTHELLIREFGEKLVTDFYKSIIDINTSVNIEVSNHNAAVAKNEEEEKEQDEPQDYPKDNYEIYSDEEEILESGTEIKGDPEELFNEDAVNQDEEFEEKIEEELEETEEDYFLEEEDGVIDEDNEIEEIINDTPVIITFNYKTRAERELADLWQNTFKEGYFETYIWENKISEIEYDKFKGHLKSCITDPNREDGFAKRFAKAIVLYCAEWYKREYNGNDGQGNPLNSIGLKLRTKDLWKWAEIDDRLLYGNEYLECIYTLGGLPVNYIVKKKYEDTVMQELSDMFNNKKTEDSSKDKIFKRNNAIQYSLRNHNGSWYKLFSTICNSQAYPLAESDSKDGIFKTFIDALKHQPIKHDKFSIDWIVEANDYTPLIRRKIRLNLNPETNGTLNNCIKDYKLGDDLKYKSEFKLYLCFYGEDDEEEQIGDLDGCEHIRFVNDNNGYFVGENVQDYYIFSQIPTKNITKIKIIAQSTTNNKYVELQEIEVAPYLELYNTWKYSTYSTKRNIGDKFVILPFDYQIQNGHTSEDTPKFLTPNGPKYRFTKINGQFKFTDSKGNEMSIYEQSNKIEVSPILHTDTFIYNDNKYFTRVVRDENGVESTESVILIFGKNDIICTQYYDGADPKVIEEEDVIIKFKKGNETFYTEWTDDNLPEQGFLKLQINVQNRKISINAYFIPSNETPIKRDCVREEIIIKDCVNIICSDADLQIKKNSSNQTIACITRTDREKQSYYFKIGSVDDYIVIPIIKPCNVTELYKDGEFVKEYNNERMASIRIPIHFKDKYSLRKYAKDGVVSHQLRYDDADILDFKFEDDETSLDKTIEKDTPAGIIDYYLCTDKKYTGTYSTGYKIRIGEKGIDNYKFYFWDMNLEHDPYPIDCDYCNGMLDMHTASHPNGIIFQSLQGDICPRHYCKPIITTHDQKWPKNLESEKVCAKCFDIASQHNIPFRIFEPIHWLLKDTDTRLVDLFAFLVYNNQVTDQKLEDLVRLSNELYFAWPFINISAWRQYKKEYEKQENGSRNMNKEQFEEMFINSAKRLFSLYGTLLNPNDSSYAEKYACIYWNDESVQLKFESYYNTNVWYAYINGKDLGYDYFRNSLGSSAIRFMRAKKIIAGDKKNNRKKGITKISDLEYKRINKKVIIIGFSNNENENKTRVIDKICHFLRIIKTDNSPFMHIISFFEKYKIIH